MGTLRSRLILSHILPILIVVPLVGLGIIYLLETQVLLDDMSRDLNERATLIAEVVEDEAGIWADPVQAQALLTEVSIFVEGDILLVEADGDLLASTDPELINAVGQPADLEGLEDVVTGAPTLLVHYNVIRTSGEALVPVVDVNNQLIGIVGVTESIEGLASDFGRLRQLVLIILAFEIILAVFLALFLARRLAGPITNVTEAVFETAEGQRADPILEEGPQEIRQLAASVNTLTSRLQELEETRRRLLANLVHEIGRPLGAIRSAIHVLRQGAADDPAVRDELLAGVEDEVKRMQPLLDDLAQLHGQVLGTRQLNREPVALSDWLASCLLPWRAAAVDKGLSWTADISPNLPTLELDPDRLSQVLGNLLSNAIKFTPVGGAVNVSAQVDDSEVLICVADDGPGIVVQERQRIFEPFFRSRQQRRFPQGLGLGLTIAQDIVQAHGGTLELDSAYEAGSRFIINLPLEPQAG